MILFWYIILKMFYKVMNLLSKILCLKCWDKCYETIDNIEQDCHPKSVVTFKCQVLPSDIVLRGLNVV